MLKIYGETFGGKFIENWQPKDGLRMNIINHIRHSSIYMSDLDKRCIEHFNDDEKELLKLQSHLQAIVKKQKEIFRQAETDLEVTKEALSMLDEAINKLIIHHAWDLGYSGAEEDLKPRKRNPKIKKE